MKKSNVSSETLHSFTVSENIQMQNMGGIMYLNTWQINKRIGKMIMKSHRKNCSKSVEPLIYMWQGTHCTGKTENGKKKSLSGKTQGIWFSDFVNSLILKVKDILIFPKKISKQFLVCQISFVSASHKSRKLAQGKFAVGQDKNREFENAI